MTAPWPTPTSRRSDLPIGEGELDADLAKLVRRTSVVRQGFYLVVLLVALAGQVSGAVEALGIPLAAAIPAVAALELGGIVVLANADVRRRLGERAVASRLLSVAIAASAVTFNWLAHDNHLLGGFFAGMSALGYLVWLMHTENQRRDRLRVKGDLPPTTPAYEVVGHWLRHPWLTVRARALAKADPRLGLYDSLASARAEIRRERRQAAISKVLHRKIKSAVDPKTADIAIAVYDLDEIAARLADNADYDGLTALIAADLAPERLAPNGTLRPLDRKARRAQERALEAAEAHSRELESTLRGVAQHNGANGSAGAGRNGANGHNGHASAVFSDPPVRDPDSEAAPRRRGRGLISGEIRGELERRLPSSRTPAPREPELEPEPESLLETESLWDDEPSVDRISLRRRVREGLLAIQMPDDQRSDQQLIADLFDHLQLNEEERMIAGGYVYGQLTTEQRARV
jgi:hypothetical protein